MSLTINWCAYVLIVYCFVLFFKRKTAYEMRISDWSSDVCSSDLRDDRLIGLGVDDVLGDGTAQDAFGKRHDGGAAFDDGAGFKRALGGAILLDGDAILAYVHKSAGEIAGRGRFQRGVGQPRASAVRGGERSAARRVGTRRVRNGRM